MLRPESVSGEPARREPRRRILDNPRVLTVAAVLLVGLIFGLIWLSERTIEIEPLVLTGILLYSLLAVALALLLTLVFVLARNLLKLWVERRRAAPFARFRTKLVAAMLAMSIIPAVLVLISGSQILATSAARWFSAPVDAVVGGSHLIASRFVQEQQEAVALRARRLARGLPPVAVARADEEALGAPVKDELGTMRDSTIELYRVTRSATSGVEVELVLAVESPALPGHHVRAFADRLARGAIESAAEQTGEEKLDSGAMLLRAAAPILGADRQAVGAVVVSRHLDAELAREARRIAASYEQYQGLYVLQGPILGSYLTIFATQSLLILIAATWLGLYLAKRITRPVQQLADGARAIGAGRLDVRLEAETSDELGSLVEAFNMMAAELQTSRERLEESREALERTHADVEARRRYVETILERVATGVVSVDAEGRVSTVNGAAARLLGVSTDAIGRALREVLDREDLRPLLPLVDAIDDRRERGIVQEVTLAREGREINLATAATVLAGRDGASEGAVVVLDDVTPLIRAQRVAAWRDVARRLAHEIKNPLTPIQLSAERMRRHFASAPAPTVALVDECTSAIVTEVEALKGLVDEFAQFARLRAPRMAPADLNQLLNDALALYGGLLQTGAVRIERQFASGLPAVRIDTEQIRQVIINLVDNAIEALGGPQAGPRPGGEAPVIIVLSVHDARNGVVRLMVSDNGPGVPPEDRDKLFMPYYSTKGRGSGLGLAIVRRIVAEHGGTIEASDAKPTGTTFTVELPAA